MHREGTETVPGQFKVVIRAGKGIGRCHRPVTLHKGIGNLICTIGQREAGGTGVRLNESCNQ